MLRISAKTTPEITASPTTAEPTPIPALPPVLRSDDDEFWSSIAVVVVGALEDITEAAEPDFGEDVDEGGVVDDEDIEVMDVVPGKSAGEIAAKVIFATRDFSFTNWRAGA